MVKSAAFILLFAAACTKSEGNNIGTCGDGELDPVREQCDDGEAKNGTTGDKCSAACTLVSICGDGIVDPGEQCDDGNTKAGDGCSATCKNEVAAATHTLNVGWSLETVAGAAAACPAGYEQAVISAVPLTAEGNPSTKPTVTIKKPCSAGLADQVVEAGLYSVTVAITDAAGTGVYATSAASNVDLSMTDGAYETTILTDGGYAQTTWTLVKASSTSTALSCGDAGVGINGRIRVRLTSTTVSSPPVHEKLLLCPTDATTGSGLSDPLAPDTYGVVIDVLNNTGETIGSTTPANVTIGTAANAVVNVTASIPIAGT